MSLKNEQTRQIEIVHLSDLHFGEQHRFIADRTPDGDRGANDGIPKLLEKLLDDLQFGLDPGCPVIVSITGDLTTIASYKEFQEVENFIVQIAESEICKRKLSLNRVFIVPGNHDVNYEGKEVGERWQRWIELNNRLFATSYKREDPWALARVNDLIDDIGLLVLCLNSSIHVKKGEPSERRGELDLKQLAKVEKELKAIPRNKLESAIRIAMIHHHPVLIPSLVEADRGYDAVLNSNKLLQILHEFGFHVVLHGHKHLPVTFLDDASCAFLDTDTQPIMIVAGGSVGSKELPDHPKKVNSYNRITIKWHPAARQARVRIVTRGLKLYNDNGTERLPEQWAWEPIKVIDKSFYRGSLPMPNLQSLVNEQAKKEILEDNDRVRRAEYVQSRGNMPVVEVMPSISPDQAYEARFWIVGHQRQASDIPVEVNWSAGPRFPVYKIRREEDSFFCGAFDYWGPMLIQAHLTFEDGKSAFVHVYARMPESYGKLW